LSSFLLENSLYFGVNEIFSSQKLVGNLMHMTIANLVGNTVPEIFELLFPRVIEKICIFGVIIYYSIPSILLKLVVCVWGGIKVWFTI